MMNTVPLRTQFQGPRPVPQAPVAQWRPARTGLARPGPRMGQGVARGADILFSLITAGAVVLSGVAVAQIVGASKVNPKPTWKYIGGIAAGIGILKLLADVSKLAAPEAPVVQTPNAA
jgi:hypothetical protein